MQITAAICRHSVGFSTVIQRSAFYQQSFFVAARRVGKRPSEAALFNFQSVRLRCALLRTSFQICDLRFVDFEGVPV
jgi:hypothetical protein